MFVFSTTGFVPVDLVEHVFAASHTACLRCILLPVVYADECPVVPHHYWLTKKEAADPVCRALIYGYRNDIANGRVVIHIISDVEAPVGPSSRKFPSDPACEYIDGLLLDAELAIERSVSGEPFIKWWDALRAQDKKKPTTLELYARLKTWR